MYAKKMFGCTAEVIFYFQPKLLERIYEC